MDDHDLERGDPSNDDFCILTWRDDVGHQHVMRARRGQLTEHVAGLKELDFEYELQVVVAANGVLAEWVEG